MNKSEDIELWNSAIKKLRDLEAVELCEKSLYEFCGYVWPVIDPGNEFVGGLTLEAICAHLEAVHLGHIKRLLITVPPGCTKSTICSVLFPIWCWGPRKEPWKRFINASYGESLSIRDNLRARRVLLSEAYQLHWPISLTQPATAIRFENEATGWKLATSVGGTLTGHRGDCIILDDPNNPKDVESEVVRRSTNTWFTEVVPTRLNNMETGAIIIIQQRVHMEDVAGTALSRDMIDVHLNLPMEYEPRAYVNAYVPGTEEIQTFIDDDARSVAEDDVFWRDWRSEPGELLWPERFSWRVVDKLKKELGPNAASSQLQQSPVPRGGSIIKYEWWNPFTEPKFPPLDFILATLDCAYTEDERNDPSALTIWGVYKETMTDKWGNVFMGNPKVVLMEAWDEFLPFHELVDRVLITCTVDDRPMIFRRFPVDRLVIENKASGISVYQELSRLVTQSGAFGVELYTPRGDKDARLHSVQHIFANGMVYAPLKDWAEKVKTQVGDFPYAGHDDYVDCTSMALGWLRACGFTPTREEAMEEWDTELAYKKKLAPLYPC